MSRRAFSASSRARTGKRSTPPGEKLLPGLTPYRGLLPFREQDERLFFGREQFVKNLSRRSASARPTNVVAVIGRSGSGKSSIVYAGLFPRCAASAASAGSRCGKFSIFDLTPSRYRNWRSCSIRPRPIRARWTCRAIFNRRAHLFRDRQVTLADLVRDRLRNETGSTRLLLYVDQWEELYTLAAPRETEDRRRMGARRRRKVVHRPRSRCCGQIALHFGPERPVGFLS